MLLIFRKQISVVMILTILPVFFILGCEKDTEELEQKILAHDPSFQDMLDQRNDLRKQMTLQRASYDKKVNNINSRIGALKDQKAMARQEYDMSCDKIKRQVEPTRRKMQTDLVDMKRRLEVARMQMRNVERDIKEIEALIDKKDTLAFTQEEIKTWNDRFTSLIEKKAEITSEEKKLQDDISVTKLKLRVVVL